MMRQTLVGVAGIVAMATMITAACSTTDSGITTAVKSRLAADETVKAYRIDVDTKDKVVMLRGDDRRRGSSTRCRARQWQPRRRRGDHRSNQDEDARRF